jgi:hypothetical protein
MSTELPPMPQPPGLPPAEPQPVSDVDDNLKHALKGLHRMRWWVLVIIGVALGCAVIVLGVIVVNQQNELEASCGFWKGAAVVSVDPVPPAKHPGPIGVKLIASSRQAYYGQRCGGKLAPNPSLAHWAPTYGATYEP